VSRRGTSIPVPGERLANHHTDCFIIGRLTSEAVEPLALACWSLAAPIRTRPLIGRTLPEWLVAWMLGRAPDRLQAIATRTVGIRRAPERKRGSKEDLAEAPRPGQEVVIAFPDEIQNKAGLVPQFLLHGQTIAVTDARPAQLRWGQDHGPSAAKGCPSLPVPALAQWLGQSGRRPICVLPAGPPLAACPSDQNGRCGDPLV